MIRYEKINKNILTENLWWW